MTQSSRRGTISSLGWSPPPALLFVPSYSSFLPRTIRHRVLQTTPRYTYLIETVVVWSYIGSTAPFFFSRDVDGLWPVTRAKKAYSLRTCGGVGKWALASAFRMRTTLRRYPYLIIGCEEGDEWSELLSTLRKSKSPVRKGWRSDIG